MNSCYHIVFFEQNMGVTKNWVRQKYSCRAHKAGHHHHLETVCENAKFRGPLLYMNVMKVWVIWNVQV